MNNRENPAQVKLALLMAMEDEALPIVNSLELQENTGVFSGNLPFRLFQASTSNKHISLVTSGKDQRYNVDNIGSEAAVLMAQEAIRCLNPQLVISAGTAGGFRAQQANIGTSYLSEGNFIFHDRHVPMAGFDKSAMGFYPSANTDYFAKKLNFPQGMISTGSSLKKLPLDIETIAPHNVVAKEMEAAAVAWICMLYKTPMFALKTITNILDEENNSEEEFSKNLQAASRSLNKDVLSLLHLIDNTSLTTI